MGNLRLFLFKISLFFVFTQGLWERVFENNLGMAFLEVSVILYIISSIKAIRINTPGFALLLGLLISSFFILLFAEGEAVSAIKYIRYLCYFYFIYNSLLNSLTSLEEWESIFKFLLILVILQGFGSAYTIFVIGEKVEGYVGLMSSLGGTTATIFPLLIVSLVLFYIYNFRLNQTIPFLILLVICSFLVSFSSGKRAIYYAVPIFIFLTFIISIILNSDKKEVLRKALYVFIIIFLVSPIYVLGIKKSHGLNYDLVGNETFGQIVTKSLAFAKEYESAESSEGLTVGRSNTSMQIVGKSLSSSNLFLFGKGFGVTKDESVREEYGFSYGIVGFTRDLLNGGWIFAIISALIFVRIILYDYWGSSDKVKILKIILLAIFVFTHFMYSSDFTVSLKISIIYAILCSFVSSCIYTPSITFQNQENQND